MTDSLETGLAAAGQDHAVRRLKALQSDAQAHLRKQLEGVDLELLSELRSLIGQPPAEAGDVRFEPPEVFPLRREGELAERAEAARKRGQELYAAGKVAFVLVAGGQASRLGYDGPKGAFPVGPVSGRTLFAFHAARLARLNRDLGVQAPWYVMTSPANDARTKEVFEENAYFGLPREDVTFFQQDMLPALDEQGRILFSSSDSLFLAPNGHGGVLLGLRSSGALADMASRGVEQLSYFQVDNPLVRPVDPLFLGLHALADAGMSSKVVSKRDAAEKVGVIGRMDGQLGCIEYSDLPEALREQRDASGQLVFGAGNIAVHSIERSFVESVTQGELRLPWHVAKKSMQVVDENGQPASTTGFKFETFVFDALASSERSVTLEVERHLEFSPVKNAQGEDSPATCRRDLCSLFAGWAQRAGLPLPAADAEGVHPVEVDPLYAETEEEFLARENHAHREHEGGHLYEG